MKKASLQDIFLNNIRKEKINVSVFLSNGVKLQGNVIAFDNFVIALKKDTNMQIIYKHAISTIVPSKFVNLQPDLQSEATVVVE